MELFFFESASCINQQCGGEIIPAQQPSAIHEKLFLNDEHDQYDEIEIGAEDIVLLLSSWRFHKAIIKAIITQQSTETFRTTT